MADEITLGAALIVGPDRLDQLKRVLAQLSKFDQVVVVNTSEQGAITNYVKRLKKPFEIYEDPFRPSSINEKTGEEYGLNDWGFARARNISLQKLKTSHAIWIDTDDILGLTYGGKDIQITAQAASDAFRKIIKEAPDVDVWFADYHYSYDENGNPNVVHARERILKNPTSWKVVYPIHECFVPDHQPKHSVITDIKFIHLPSLKAETSSARNMRMLKDWGKQLEKYGDSHDIQRCNLQIGETYWGLGDYKKAANWLEHEYLDQYPNAVSLERWQAAGFAAKSYIRIGNLTGARRMALKAMDLEPALMDGYLLLAEVKWLGEEDPHDILALLQTGGGMEDPPPQVIKNPLDYTFTPFCITSGCKFKQGQYEVALDFALKALKIRPNDPAAEALRRQAAEKVRIEDGAKAASALYQLLKDYDEPEKAAKLLTFLPYPLQRTKEILDIHDGAKKRVAHIEDPKVYEDYWTDPPEWQPTPWDGFEKNYVPGRDRYQWILSRLRKNPKIKNVLIIGCDDGYHSILLAKAGYTVTGIDLNKEAIRIATERADKLGVSAKFKQGWFEKIEPDRTRDLFDATQTWMGNFDAVIASEQIDKVRDLEFFLETMGDCLKVGGSMILTTPNGAWDAGDIPFNRKEGEYPGAVRAFTQENLEAFIGQNQNYWMTECHYLPYSQADHSSQGWQVAELVKGARPIGPRIRIFCGEKVESFSPTSLVTGGTGGSETAVIQMAQSWSAMGCQVVIYRGPIDEPDTVGVYDGVFYRLADEFDTKFESDIFISWRLPHVFSLGRPNAKTTVLWNHDLYYPIVVKPEWYEYIDVFAVLSNFHKESLVEYHKFPKEKIWVTRNGIDPLRFKQTVEKRKHHYFFTSSHERGLKELLAIWPDIRKAIPDAVLHVGYGTNTVSMIMKDRGDLAGMDEIRSTEQEMYETEGVEYHQRLNQWELAKIQMECEAWLYPYQPTYGTQGGFLETYCITALEAMAAKAIPFTRLNGALPEVVPHYVEWTKDMKATDVIRTLKNLDLKKYWSPELTEKNYKWAMSQSWSSLAKEWVEKLTSNDKVDV
jgi:SAM-dependent methyltransferase